MKKLVVLMVAAVAALALAGCGGKPSTPTAAPTTTTTIRLEPSDCGYRLTSWRQNDESARMRAVADADDAVKYGTRLDSHVAEGMRRDVDDMVIAAHQIGCNWAAGAVIAGDRLIEFNPPPLALSGVVR